MKSEINRRNFLGTAAASGAFTLVPRHVLGAPFVPPSDKITLAYVGIGTQGIREMIEMLPIPGIQIVAVCDPEKDSNHYVEFQKGEMIGRIRKLLDKPNWRAGVTGAPGGRMVGKEMVETFYAEKRAADHFGGVKAYADFRELLDKEKDLDSVKIMTPDHMHATIAIAAMKKKKHVIVHKPIANRMQEFKLVCDLARQTKLATHCMAYGSGRGADIPKVLGWIKDGAIGTLREIHDWTNRPMWPQFDSLPTERPPVPPDFDWQMWLGPVPDRPYSPNYTHTLFRGWYEFGAGSLADIGLYSFWPIFRAFELGAPVKIEPYYTFKYAVNNEVSSRVKNEVGFPNACTVRYKMPAQGAFPNLKVFWHDGGMKPPRPDELEEDGRELGPEGIMFVGDKGTILDGKFIPESKNRAYGGSQSATPRPGGGMGGYQSLGDWMKACKGGPPSPGNFLNAIPVHEAINLGGIALRTGKTLQYDAAAGKVTNVPEANNYFTREYRKGWEL